MANVVEACLHFMSGGIPFHEPRHTYSCFILSVDLILILILILIIVDAFVCSFFLSLRRRFAMSLLVCVMVIPVAFPHLIVCH